MHSNSKCGLTSVSSMLGKDFRPYTKEMQTASRRVKLTQKQMGAISPKVRKEVKERSKGVCEVRMKCTGSRAVHMAHKRGRRRMEHRTTAKDLWHACLVCHVWLDTTAEGERFKKERREQEK